MQAQNGTKLKRSLLCASTACSGSNMTPLITPLRPGINRLPELFRLIPYHLLMRFLLLILLTTLLLLRGWVGDAMATEMAVGQLRFHATASKSSVSHPHEADATGHFYHQVAASEAFVPVHATQAAHHCAEPSSFDSASKAANADCGSCAFCQACNTLALNHASAELSTGLTPRSPPHFAATQFASAEAALGQKPPIS